MHKGRHSKARSLFATILPPEVDSHIADQLPQLLGSSSGASQLESVGQQMIERRLDRPLDAISAEVAAQTGAPVQATHTITGIVGATLLGLLKRHFLEGQGNVGQLPALLGQQLPVIAPYLNDCLLGALGAGGLGAFTGSILSQLEAVSEPAASPTAASSSSRSSKVRRSARNEMPASSHGPAWFYSAGGVGVGVEFGAAMPVMPIPGPSMKSSPA
jgi:hypothetical protein